MKAEQGGLKLGDLGALLRRPSKRMTTWEVWLGESGERGGATEGNLRRARSCRVQGEDNKEKKGLGRRRADGRKKAEAPLRRQRAMADEEWQRALEKLPIPRQGSGNFGQRRDAMIRFSLEGPR
mmetsp:Transcript_3474/g.10516  ORF Transcript_3474/g.10516 Transcript_3474/m.10516 type:complete len:124 (-) Transcript_3474:147-518(-)